MEQYLGLENFELHKNHSIVEPPEKAHVKSTVPFDGSLVVERVPIESVD